MDKARKFLVIVITIFSMFSLQSQGAIFNVTNSTELQTDLDTARTNDENDTIYLQQGIYITNGGPFTYGTTSNDNHSVTLSGGWNSTFTAQVRDPNATQLDGNGANQVLQILANATGVNITFTIENLTIENGYTNSSDPCGAGIEAYTGGTGQGSIHLDVNNCIFQSNSAANNRAGGAIYSNCTLEISNSRFLTNSASNGGAMYITNDPDANQSASPIIKNCYFEDNTNYGNQGHDIWHNVALQVRGCTFKGRTNGGSSGPGAAIMGYPGSHLNITNSVFSGITIQYWGSAILAWNCDLDVTNCLFADNHAGVGGDGYGAIAYYSASNTINITNCTFTGNTDASSSGAINNRGATMNLNNCIFWDNDGYTGINNESGTTTMNYCDYYDDMGSGVTDGGGNINEDPMFIGEGIYHLGHWSSCIDAGNNNLVPADSQDLNNDGNTTQPTPLDLGGMARFYDDPCTDDTGLGTASIVDIGAFEFQPGYFANFGTVNGKNVTLTMKDCDGNDVTFSLTGGGYGRIDPCDCSFSDIALYETTEKSVFTISTKGKNETSVGSIGVSGPLKAIAAKNVNLSGIIELDGSLGTVTLNDISGDHSRLRIGSSTNQKATVMMSFDQVDGLQIDSDMPIKSITATEWVGNNSDIYAPWVGSITIKGDTKRSIAGDFDIYIDLSGTGAPKGLTLGSIKVAGRILGETWNVTGNIGTVQIAASNQSFDMEIHDGNLSALTVSGNKTSGIAAVLKGRITCNSIKSISTVDISNESLTVTQTPDSAGKKLALGTLTAKGQIANCQISSTGNIGTVTAGKMVNSTCFAGVADACMVDVNAADGVFDLPLILDNTFDQTATIKSFTIKGIKGETYCFINSNIASKNITGISIAYPQYNNSSVPFGISIYNDPALLTIKDANGTHSWKKGGLNGKGIGDAVDWLKGQGYDMQLRRD